MRWEFWPSLACNVHNIFNFWDRLEHSSIYSSIVFQECIFCGNFSKSKGHPIMTSLQNTNFWLFNTTVHSPSKERTFFRFWRRVWSAAVVKTIWLLQGVNVYIFLCGFWKSSNVHSFVGLLYHNLMRSRFSFEKKTTTFFALTSTFIKYLRTEQIQHFSR